MIGALPWTDWLALFGHMLLLSFVAVGGALVLAPDLHRLLIDEYGLLTPEQFAAAIAIAQVSPGPNLLYVSVLGFQGGGLGGAAIILGAMMLPSTLLALSVARWGRTRGDLIGVRAFKVGMAPLTVALMLSSGWVIAVAKPTASGLALAIVSMLIVWRTRVHLLVLIAVGGAIGAMGWV